MPRRKNYTAAQKRAYAKRMQKSRVSRSISGKGDYKFKAARDFGRAGALAGDYFGGPVGAAAGEVAGGLLGKLFKKVTGFGDYEVKSNTLLGKGNGVIPDFGKSAIRITHKEFLQNVDSTTDFNLFELALNPGVKETFPWLAPIAQQFETYRMNGCIVYYKSTSADALNSTNTALGKIVISTDYNSSDTNWQNIQQMYGSQYAVSGPPSSDLMHAVECDERFLPHNNMLFVRTGAPNEGSNIIQYDHGKLQIATSGAQQASESGELWIAYDITLANPVMNNVIGEDVSHDRWDLAMPLTTTTKMGDITSAVSKSGGIGGFLSTNRYTFPASLSSGYYMLTYVAFGSNASIGAPTIVAQNCTILPHFPDSPLSLISGRININPSSSVTVNVVVRINAQDAYIDLGTTAVWPVSVTEASLDVVQLNAKAFL